MEILPTEIIFNIFTKLSLSDLCNLCLVSRKLYTIASDQTLWRYFILNIHVDQVLELDKISTIPRLERLKTIAISGRGEKTTHVRNMIKDSHFCMMRNMKYLDTITITNCNLSQVTLKLMSLLVDRLSSITLDRSYLTKLHYHHMLKDLVFHKSLTKLSIVRPKYGLLDIAPTILANAVVTVREVTFR